MTYSVKPGKIVLVNTIFPGQTSQWHFTLWNFFLICLYLTQVGRLDQNIPIIESYIIFLDQSVGYSIY